MRFLLLHAIEESIELDPARQGEISSSLASWIGETIRTGTNLAGSRLQPVRDATTVRVRNGEFLISDGPFAETKEQVAGYDILECPDRQRALEVAARHPTAKLGLIEVRAIARS